MTQISRFLGSRNDKAEQNCNTIVCNLLSTTKIYFSELLPMNKIFALYNTLSVFDQTILFLKQKYNQ